MNDKSFDAETIGVLRHDIKNQLSNIHLALENLRYEVGTPTADFSFYFETISSSATKINELLQQLK